MNTAYRNRNIESALQAKRQLYFQGLNDGFQSQNKQQFQNKLVGAKQYLTEV